ncbi:sulfotransferase family protein [Thalassotalea eurytherma]|uniref:Sulfotransferase n=1 Tax=Thalassotalea eurytherma TaxID=1144278 RepID=A0ABQ6H3L2_9GAMM|nr:sulfotransferase [Thalassotalea eurytherma]GLX82099.1 sulfotransferase [Thalassotalea eurytherma]
MNCPNFIVIGAQRAGTTWLHLCLNEHPEIFLPEEKEIHFFDLHYEKGLHWYFEHFKGEDKVLNGEITPNYYQYPEALARMKQNVPDAKIIFILREPKSRAISQFDLFKQDNFKNFTFAQAIEKHPVIIDLSLQGLHLQRLYEHFEHDQVLVLLYDELANNPRKLLHKVTKFLGISSQFTPSLLHKKMNKVVFPKTQAFIRKIGLSWLIELAKKSRYSERVKKLGERKPVNNNSFKIDDDVQQCFLKDIELIEQLTGKNLSHWKLKVSS